MCHNPTNLKTWVRWLHQPCCSHDSTECRPPSHLYKELAVMVHCFSKCHLYNPQNRSTFLPMTYTYSIVQWAQGSKNEHMIHREGEHTHQNCFSLSSWASCFTFLSSSSSCFCSFSPNFSCPFTHVTLSQTQPEPTKTFPQTQQKILMMDFKYLNAIM